MTSQHEKVIDALFGFSPEIRYVALFQNDVLTLRQRGQIANASSGESDRFEELVVNPTLLTLARQRGKIDCGGLRFLIVGYGNFFQLLREIPGGHVSICLEKDSDVIILQRNIFDFLPSQFPGIFV